MFALPTTGRRSWFLLVACFREEFLFSGGVHAFRGGVHAFKGSFCVDLLNFALVLVVLSFYHFCSCAGCVELLPLLEEPAFDLSFAFTQDRCWDLFCLLLRDHVFLSQLGRPIALVFGNWDFSFWEILFLPFHLAFESSWMSFILIFFLVNLSLSWNCVVCCQCTHQGGDWGPMVVTPGCDEWLTNVACWCLSWLWSAGAGCNVVVDSARRRPSERFGDERE